MTVSLRRVWRYAALAVFMTGALWLLWKVRGVFIPFILGFLLAYLLVPAVDALEQKGFRRSQAILLIYMAAAAALGLFFAFILPLIVRDMNRLMAGLQDQMTAAERAIRDIQTGYGYLPLPESLRATVDDLLAYGQSWLVQIVQGFMWAAVRLVSQVFNLLLAPVLGYYFLKDFQGLGASFLKYLPVRFRTEAAQIGAEISAIIRNFIRGNLIVSALVTVLASCGLYLIGMDYPVLIGLMVGLTNFIPYVGAFIAAVPAVLLAFIKSKWMALYVLGLMMAIQQLEGNIISPKIIGDSIGLHPLTLTFVLLAGGHLWGYWGLLAAAPLAAIGKVFIRHIYRHLLGFR